MQYNTIEFDSDETELSEMMRWYWGTMSKNGNPGNGDNTNNKLAIEWSQYTKSKEETIALNTKKLNVLQNSDTETCELWDGFNYPWFNKPNFNFQALFQRKIKKTSKYQ